MSTITMSVFNKQFISWFYKYGVVAKRGVDINPSIQIGDLDGMMHQIEAEDRGWADKVRS